MVEHAFSDSLWLPLDLRLGQLLFPIPPIGVFQLSGKGLEGDIGGLFEQLGSSRVGGVLAVEPGLDKGLVVGIEEEGERVAPLGVEDVAMDPADGLSA